MSHTGVSLGALTAALAQLWQQTLAIHVMQELSAAACVFIPAPGWHGSSPLVMGVREKINISQLYTCPHKLPGKQLGALCSPSHVVQHPKGKRLQNPFQGGCSTELCSPALQVATGAARQSRDSVPTRLPRHSPQ